MTTVILPVTVGFGLGRSFAEVSKIGEATPEKTPAKKDAKTEATTARTEAPKATPEAPSEKKDAPGSGALTTSVVLALLSLA